VIDPVHSVSELSQMPVVLLAGSPVIHSETARALDDYVGNGGKLVVSGTWPARDNTGSALKFLGGAPADGKKVSIGKGTVWWVSPGLGSGLPEEDSLKSIGWLRELLDRETPAPHVKIEPDGDVSWVDWNNGKNMKSEGGARTYVQPRNLLSAVLHEGPEDQILFLLNHYPTAARGKVTFRDAAVIELVDLATGETHSSEDGSFAVDLDRKSASVFRIRK